MASVNKFMKKSFNSEFISNSFITSSIQKNDGYFCNMQICFEHTQDCANDNTTDILQKILHCESQK